MLEDILKERKCFKLVCGAGNEDVDEVEKLVAVYAKAGANYFDLSAKKEIVLAAHNGLRKVIKEKDIKNYFFNVSVGIKGDPHVSKAEIDKDKCIGCGSCSFQCGQDAIIHENGYSINQKRCIGCGKCIRECSFNAIVIKSQNQDLEEILPPLINVGIDSIELHAVSDDIEKIYSQWKVINEQFNGIASVCMDRSHASDIELEHRIRTMIKNRNKFTTIIQADGAPMSGNDDKYETTLQAVATAQIVQRLNLPIYLLLSGGTNSKSVTLAQMCGVKANGIAIGSYGRMIIKKYIQRSDFWEKPEIFNAAYEIAKKLVETCLHDLQE